MGRIFTFISLLGYAFLAVIVVIAILALFGVFEPSLANPAS